MIIGIGTDLHDASKPFWSVTEIGFETVCSQISNNPRPSVEWMRRNACQTLGRKRGLFQGTGDGAAHGDRMERYGRA